MLRRLAAFRTTLSSWALGPADARPCGLARTAESADRAESRTVVVTFVAYRTPVALRPRLADTTAVKNQRVGGHDPFRRWQRSAQLLFDDDGIVRRRDADAVRHTQHMAVDRETRHAERVAEYHVRGLAADARELDERLHRVRHFAAVLFGDRRRHADQRFRFRAEETGRLDDGFELGGGGAGKRPGGGVAGEQGRRDLVHALVGALRGEDGRREQLERIAVIELGIRVRMLRFQPCHDAARSRRILDSATAGRRRFLRFLRGGAARRRGLSCWRRSRRSRGWTSCHPLIVASTTSSTPSADRSSL